MMEHWFTDCPKGKEYSIDCTKQFSINELSTRAWYVIDLRSKPDKWTNQIHLQHLEKCSEDAKARMCFTIYEKVKSLIIYADKIQDIPKTLSTLSVLGLTQEKGNDCATFLTTIVSKTPHNMIPYNIDHKQLCGVHRFEDQPVFVSF